MGIVVFQTKTVIYLLRLVVVFRGTAVGSTEGAAGILAVIGTGAVGAGFVRTPCSSTSSCMVRFRSACGIRLMRISSRVRNPCACKAYWVRSLRARSVTT
jgi:hypothetical protein